MHRRRTGALRQLEPPVVCYFTSPEADKHVLYLYLLLEMGDPYDTKRRYKDHAVEAFEPLHQGITNKNNIATAVQHGETSNEIA